MGVGGGFNHINPTNNKEKKNLMKKQKRMEMREISQKKKVKEEEGEAEAQTMLNTKTIVPKKDLIKFAVTQIVE